LLAEWRRVLKPNGLLITNCPDQQKFLAHCKATGQPLNLAHKEQDFSLKTFVKVANLVGKWEEVFVKPDAGPYSFYVVLKKIKTA
jgi:ubiquinone/menaquinone biosynthesis C-methylase UbiE